VLISECWGSFRFLLRSILQVSVKIPLAWSAVCCLGLDVLKMPYLLLASFFFGEVFKYQDGMPYLE